MSDAAPQRSPRLLATTVLAIFWGTTPPVWGFVLLAYLGPVSEWLRASGDMGVAVFVACFVVAAGVGLLPTYAQAILGGWAFGFGVGLGASIVGFVGGGLLGWLISRAISGASSFVDQLPDGIEVGLVAFDSDARLLVSPTTDHGAVKASIAGLKTNERTATGEGIYTSLEAIQNTLAKDGDSIDGKTGEEVPAAIVLLSDGVPTVGRSPDDAAAAAKEAHVPISTIAYGTPNGTLTMEGETVSVASDPETMQRIAQEADGRSFEAQSAGELKDVYAAIQTTIGFETVPREVGRAALGGAFAVLLVAGAYAVLTSARPL